jgi:hypothetical protein
MKQTVQNLLSPSVKKRNTKGSNRKTVAIICSKHGFFKSGYCKMCEHDMKQATAIHTHDWVKGIWTDIAPEPIYIESKEHLFRECEKRGVMPRAFMKPRSQGAGFEIAKGR